MGKTRLLAVIAALLTVAILAVLLLPGNEAQPEQKKEEEEPLVSVAAATKEIPAFTVITEDMVYLKEVPESCVHENYLSSIGDVVGRRSLVTMVSDEVIMLNHILDPDAPENRLAYKIENGMRAMTVPVDDTSGVCNQIRAGDYVDVIVAVQDVDKEDKDREEDEEQTARSEKNAGRIVSVMTLQNIRVLALDQDTLYAPRQETGIYYYRDVTLAVTPEDAVKLGWAQYEGKVYLSLRGENDAELKETEPYGAEKALQMEGEG